MAIVDELQIIDGYFENDRFIICGIAGHAVYADIKLKGSVQWQNWFRGRRLFIAILLTGYLLYLIVLYTRNIQ